MYQVYDTIAAIASAAGGAARGILRLSGPGVVQVLAATFRPCDGLPVASVRSPRRLPGNLLVDRPDSPQLQIPADLYFWPGSRSYTRQPVGELHTLGSPPLLAAALRALCAAGARPAEPGEFTLRAFLAGRLDLTQAEAVLGVIDATGRRDFDDALAQLAGGLTGPLADLREQLLNLLAHLEAGLDFVEEDIEFIAADELDRQLTAVAEEIAALAERVSQRSSVVELPRVVLLGLPNVGKSSLFNALTGSAGAIVANQPGTTRDYVSARVELDGCACELVDTAGMEGADGEAPESIHAAAQSFTQSERERTDVRIVCLDASQASISEVNAACALANATNPGASGAIVVLTKSDANVVVWSDVMARSAVVPSNVVARTQVVARSPDRATTPTEGLPVPKHRPTITESPASEFRWHGQETMPQRASGWHGRETVPQHEEPTPQHEGQAAAIATSAKTGQGLEPLRAEIRRRVLAIVRPEGGSLLPSAERAGTSLRLCAHALARALSIHRAAGGEELVAAELRTAIEELGKVAGAVYTDDILDRVFSRFCIGK